MASVADTSHEAGQQGNQQVVVGTTAPGPTSQNLAAKKLIVAVHGVGDQSSYATLQSVFNQFCRFHGEPSGIPLGAFHNGQSTFSVPKNERRKLEALAFAEVYWAKIPRDVVAEKHTLEEAKRWATTIVERLRMRLRSTDNAEACRVQDFALSTQILHEMIETISVADRLCYLADRAGIFTFDLRQVLDDYLGDVQIVTEFRTKREEILEAFCDLMSKAHAQCPGAEIYIVAHSEGTVVSLLGLLEAFRDPARETWARHVRGLMTLGSPIDKHLFFWPELFRSEGPAYLPPQPIAWRNYFDYGDPIGFELEVAREWLTTTASETGTPGPWLKVFEFQKKHDFGFTRYPFPGKAHVDYWTDDAVFDHFIGTVIDPPTPQNPKDGRRESAPPRGIVTSWISSWVLPYVGVFALLFLAAYVLTKAVMGAKDEGAGAKGSLEIMNYAIGGALLLFGTTIAARIPRLTRSWFWWVIGFAAAMLCGLLFRLTAQSQEVGLLGLPAGTTRLIVASVIVVLATIIGIIRPQWGATPLIGLGAIGITVLVFDLVRNAPGIIWPVFLAGVAFLYLWWLAALMFDLVVVWHIYIRHSLFNKRIRDLTSRRSPEAQVAEAA